MYVKINYIDYRNFNDNFQSFDLEINTLKDKNEITDEIKLLLSSYMENNNKHTPPQHILLDFLKSNNIDAKFIERNFIDIHVRK